MKLYRVLLPLLLVLAGAGCVSLPYGAPPDTTDPWELIGSARHWLQQGRPRAAVPSLERAQVEVERLRADAAAYAHARAAIHNEYGRVYEMTSALEAAEAQFLQAAALAQGVPERRPLHFDISYNLSTVYERMGQPAKSCTQLERVAALYRDLLARPAEPPAGYGDAGAAFLRDIAAPRIRARAERLGCPVDLGE